MTPSQLCSHALTNGQMCKAIALTGKKFCYYHQRDRDRQARLDQNLDHRRNCIANERTNEIIALLPDGKSSFDDNSAELFQQLQLPNLEDADAIQTALSTLFRAIATQQVSSRTAGLMLYTLQIASCNLKNVNPPDCDFNRNATVDDSPITPFTPYADSPLRNFDRQSSASALFRPPPPTGHRRPQAGGLVDSPPRRADSRPNTTLGPMIDFADSVNKGR